MGELFGNYSHTRAMGRFSEIVWYDLSVTKARGTRDTHNNVEKYRNLIAYYSFFLSDGRDTKLSLCYNGSVAVESSRLDALYCARKGSWENNSKSECGEFRAGNYTDPHDWVARPV